MPKAVTPRERLLSYAMTATREQLDEAMEIFRAVSKSRFSQPVKRKKAKPVEEVVEQGLKAAG